MVTMRRDVAVMNGNGIFDRPDRDSYVTEYDRFMQEKKRRETSALSAGTVSYNDVRMPTNYFGYSDIKDAEPKSNNEYSDYSDYMRAQLHRTTGGKILTKEEFYADRVRESKLSTASLSKGTAARKRGLNKNGKIFVAIYVLVVMVVASIILTVNTTKSDNVERADATGEGGIGALAMDVEEPETNWFDAFCDAVSNK